TQWSKSPPCFPHRLILDLGASVTVSGFRYLPRPGDVLAGGRIQDYGIYVGDVFLRGKPPVDLLPEKVYLFSYFTDYGADGLHLAWSRDGYSWEALNRGRSFLAPGLGGTNLLRDPCLLLGPDGVFRMVWTCAWTGDSIGYAWSKDLIHWSRPVAIPVMAGELNVHNCWAPEIYWDAQQANYLIIWASAVSGKFPETELQNEPNDNQRLYFTTTRDFKSFTPTAVFFDQGLSVIDPVIVPANGGHYLIFKDETSHPRAQNLRVASGNDLRGPYRLLDGAFSVDSAEGPAAFAVDHEFLCLFHLNSNNSWGAMRTRDFEHWTDVSERLYMPHDAHAGTVLQVGREVLLNLWQANRVEIGPNAESADLGLGSWIWADTVADKQTVRLWRSFIVPPGALVSRASLRITADNGYRAFLDGREIGRGGDYNDLTEYDLTQLLAPGQHILAVEGFNDALAAGVIAGLKVQLLSGRTLDILSDASWRVAPPDEKNWTTRGQPGADWKPASIVGFAGKFEWLRPKRILSSPPLLPQQIYFWQRGWFLTLVLAASALALLFSIRQGLKLAVHMRSQKLLDRERARIARDMHDELGSGLTQLTLLGELVLRETRADGAPRARLTELCTKARLLLRSMDEIVWAVNPRRDTVKDFAAFISEHAQEYLASTAIRCRQDVAEELPDLPLDLPQRRNMLLAVKEAVRNAARHSG
ncbi:MAG TPA: histidine kinase, partial [Verrucomicrobiae bacterium]